MIYLTYGDPPSGVYSSQVGDVVNYLNREMKAGIRLVAFVSLRGYWSSRRRIRSETPDATVLPIIPKINYWVPSAAWFTLVCLLQGEKKVMARGVLAGTVALWAGRLVSRMVICYDGRGAIAAEWKEYDVAPYLNLNRSIHRLESEAVLRSDFRVAVSGNLVDYWKEEFGYLATGHVIIPCTLSTGFVFELPDETEMQKIRSEWGAVPEDVVLVYSGSVSGWQSFSLVSDFVRPLLHAHKNVKLLFLSGDDPHIRSLLDEFPGQVTRRWVAYSAVRPVLAACDYGLLLREPRVTNRVAAPTKFAEYLGAGLPVLASEGIGDYSGFIKTHGCGTVLGSATRFDPVKPTRIQKEQCMALAREYFTKASQEGPYRALLAALNQKSEATD